MKIKISTLCLFISVYNYAQVAGYMGKRFVIGYDNYFLPAIIGPGASNDSRERNNTDLFSNFSPGFNTTHCLTFDYAIKQRTNFCFAVQYLKTGISYIEKSYPHGISYAGDFSTPATLSSINTAVGIKFFRRGCIAPLGNYIKFEFVLFFETVKYDNTHFTINNMNNYYNQQEQYTAGTGMYNYKNLGITCTFGKQRVLFDKLVLDYGVRFGFVPSAVLTFLNDAEESYYSNMDDFYKTYSRYRLFRQQLVNLHVGIGFLAF